MREGKLAGRVQGGAGGQRRQACATIPVKQPQTPQQPAQTPATPSIALTKTAVPNSCKGNPIACDFNVTITNTGAQPAANQTGQFQRYHHRRRRDLRLRRYHLAAAGGL